MRWYRCIRRIRPHPDFGIEPVGAIDDLSNIALRIGGETGGVERLIGKR
jgi:hypothetical protein